MQNPFKVKGREVAATVTQIWQNEVQVKTADGITLWRTMCTVWYPGKAPLARSRTTATAETVVANSSSPPENTGAPEQKTPTGAQDPAVVEPKLRKAKRPSRKHSKKR